MKTNNLFRLACTFLCCITCSLGYAKDIYVSSGTSASDSNDGGTALTPVATLSMAITKADNNDIIHIDGMLDLTKEPVGSEGNGSIDINGSSTLVVGGITYSTWNANKGNNGIKPLNKIVTFIGNDKETCGFDGKSKTRLLRIDGVSSLCTFQNLTFQNGNSYKDGDTMLANDCGAGIYLRNSLTRFEDCIFKDNISLCPNNDGAKKGGAIFYNVNSLSDPGTFVNCDFEGNQAREGSAFHVIAALGGLEISGCHFKNNGNLAIPDSKGGAIFLQSIESKDIIMTIEKSVFEGNVAKQFAGVAFVEDQNNEAAIKLTFMDCSIVNNMSDGQGGVFRVNKNNAPSLVDLKFINTTIFGNMSAEQGSIGIFENAKANTFLTILNSTITGNKSVRDDNPGHAGFRITSNSTALVKKIYNSIIEGNYNVVSNKYVDFAFQGNLPAHFVKEGNDQNIFLENSFISALNRDAGLFDNAVDAPTCIMDYYNNRTLTEGVIDGAIIAGLDTFDAATGSFPLTEDAAAINFGDAKFLKELNISTDQLGNPRLFKNEKCDAGAVEKSIIDQGEPDLVVQDILWEPEKLENGTNVIFKAVIKNQGDGSTKAGEKHTVSFTVNDALVSWSDDYTDAIAAGAEVTLTANGGPDGVASFLIGAGANLVYTIKAEVNYTGEIEESDDTNNTFTKEMGVNLLPDLVVTNISWEPEFPKTGDKVVFTAIVKNQGLAATPDGKKHGVAFAVDGVGTSWSDTHHASLAPGEEITLTASGGPQNVNYWICGTKTTYQVRAEVNDTNDFEESDRSNNATIAELNITPSGIKAIFVDGNIFIEDKTLNITGYPASASLTIYNLQGQTVVSNSSIGGGNLSINLLAGVYIVYIQDNAGSEIRKVIIE